AEGNCIETDYEKMLRIVRDAGYTGHIGIEYEGDKLSAEEGILATQALLGRVGASLSSADRRDLIWPPPQGLSLRNCRSAGKPHEIRVGTTGRNQGHPPARPA